MDFATFFRVAFFFIKKAGMGGSRLESGEFRELISSSRFY